MLNKKSLAVTLMGLGLAGTCFAAQNSVEVTFTANVQAATCKFSVTGDTVGNTTDAAAQEGAVGTASFVFDSLNLNQEVQEKKMVFTLDCGGGNPGYVPFTSVTIQGNPATGTLTADGTEGGKADFVFYNDNNGSVGTSWDNGKIEFTAGDDNVYSETKWVGFVMDDESQAGNYSASVKYTATYK